MSRDPHTSRHPKSNNPPLLIEQIVLESNFILKNTKNPDPSTLAIGAEINQNFIDYLDELDDGLLSGEISIQTEVYVVVDGTKIRFKDTDGFTNWLSENMT